MACLPLFRVTCSKDHVFCYIIEMADVLNSYHIDKFWKIKRYQKFVSCASHVQKTMFSVIKQKWQMTLIVMILISFGKQRDIKNCFLCRSLFKLKYVIVVTFFWENHKKKSVFLANICMFHTSNYWLSMKIKWSQYILSRYSSMQDREYLCIIIYL